MEQLTAILAHPLMKIGLVSIVVSALVSAMSFAGRKKIAPTEATGDILPDGNKNKYVRRAMPWGLLSLGKNQWLWGIVWATLAWYIGELPRDFGQFVTIVFTAIIATGFHSVAKNAGKESVVELIGPLFANRWISKVKKK